MSDQSSPIILVDGSSYLYRAFFASQQANLKTSDGRPTGAVRVVVSMLKSLMKQYPSSPVVVVFDAKGKTFRDDLYPEYKSHRPPMPDDLRSQIEPIHQLVEALGLPLLMVEGVEADDVIGTLARQAEAASKAVLISTGDKDMAQLVDGQVELIDTMKGKRTDREEVFNTFGVWPEQIIDYLALVGDTADNIPGVPKCGPKTAAKWLTEFGSLENLMANADKIKGKVGENLRDSLSFLPLSYQLATIKTDVELSLGLEDMKIPAPDTQRLKELYQAQEFKSWVTELEAGEPLVEETAVTVRSVERHYQTIFDESELKVWVEKLRASGCFAFDTETTSLNYMEADLVGVSFAIEVGKAVYVPVAHDYLGAPAQISRTRLLELMGPLLEDASVSKIGQHIKYDMNVLARYGITLRGCAFDTMLESYVWNATASRHDMGSLASFYLQQPTISFEELAGKGKKQLTFNQIELDVASEYAAEDADITLQLHQHLQPLLAGCAEMQSVYQKIEIPLIPILSKIERQGVLLDSALLAQISGELDLRMSVLVEEAHEDAGEAFNLASPKQLQEILYQKKGLPVRKKTPKGAPSTAEEVLQELALDYPLPRLILEHRSLSKLKSTYADKLPQMVNIETGRVHTSYHQAVTATGRLSSSDPNLQNIPIRSSEGRRIRQAFIAAPGHQLLAADYSQIELRIMAHLSADQRLIAAFAQGEDIHKATAAEVFSVSLEEVSSDQRRSAKAINFGLIYGMSAFGLAKQLGITRNQAQLYIDHYFETYPGVLAYMDRIRQQASEQGYVETIFGRRLYLPEINARNGMRRQAAERTAINAPMQGSAADIIKLAMIEVDRWLTESGYQARMIMQVHDELVLEVPDEELDEVREGLKRIMESAANLEVPLLVETGVGNNWDQAH